ncbi:MurR/RpiR family transcriptional regulator [Youngiibacter fragilis]|uniref:RpiR family transcriptional regulator n=1 Tax=Youngiibacter fragilis 232.1 TaxID=994573 RepID=V7IAH8_9CLOT|nr:MurR/RpiR family transcriptional regulator [Youngiibacter fragilis]ETA82349.1 RpiR family transcriptional regulator [Youngiibacter fragilis 232.1]
MGELLNRLLIILNNGSENTTYHHIANIMLVNFNSLRNMTISDIADLCYVSKSTISKFARHIGFEDFSELKLASSYKSDKLSNNLNFNDNILSFLLESTEDEYIDRIIDDLMLMKKSLNFSKIDQLVDYIVKYDKVAAFGLLFSESAAMDFQMKLAYNEKYIITHINDVEQNEFIKNADKDTFIIIFTNSGNYIKKYQLITTGNIEKNVFKNTKAKIVVITSNSEMEKHPYVDLCITYRHASSIQTHPILFQLITDFIASRYRKKKIEQLKV